MICSLDLPRARPSFWQVQKEGGATWLYECADGENPADDSPWRS
jgi:hypothetical protein